MDEKTKLRTELSKKYPDVMDTTQATAKYEFIGFLSPYVSVKDRKTGIKGSLEFTHMPRFYFNFIPN